MSTEYYLFDEKRGEIFDLRDIIKPDKLYGFINRVYHHNDCSSGGPLQIISDAVVDTYSPFPQLIKIESDITGGGRVSW